VNRTDRIRGAVMYDEIAPDRSIEAARSAGGSVICEVQTMPNGLSFGYVANPDGAVFGVWCPPG